MKNKLLLLFIAVLALVAANAQDSTKKIRITDDLEIIPLSKNAYLHVSWVTVAPYGRFTDNGLIYISNNEAVIMDTPMNDTLGRLLLNWFKNEFPSVKIKYVIATHFHNDCLGALRSFHEAGIVSFAEQKTINLLPDSVVKPMFPFDHRMEMKLGKEVVISRYFGEAHTKDNIVTWIPSEKILFGGCMIKSLDGGRGFLGDANVKQWSATVAKVKKEYPDAKIVIPGHGDHGGTELLDHTIKMFENDAK
jgi:metallo-beta-lactamase class B